MSFSSAASMQEMVWLSVSEGGLVPTVWRDIGIEGSLVLKDCKLEGQTAPRVQVLIHIICRREIESVSGVVVDHAVEVDEVDVTATADHGCILIPNCRHCVFVVANINVTVMIASVVKPWLILAHDPAIPRVTVVYKSVDADGRYVLRKGIDRGRLSTRAAGGAPACVATKSPQVGQGLIAVGWYSWCGARTGIIRDLGVVRGSERVVCPIYGSILRKRHIRCEENHGRQ
jgi:hypothetical protein